MRLFDFSVTVNSKVNSHFHVWVLCNRHIHMEQRDLLRATLFLGFFQWNMSLPAHWAANWPTLHI